MLVAWGASRSFYPTVGTQHAYPQSARSCSQVAPICYIRVYLTSGTEWEDLVDREEAKARKKRGRTRGITMKVKRLFGTDIVRVGDEKDKKTRSS
jgi:hypothetical protein